MDQIEAVAVPCHSAILLIKKTSELGRFLDRAIFRDFNFQKLK